MSVTYLAIVRQECRTSYKQPKKKPPEAHAAGSGGGKHCAVWEKAQ